MLIKVLTRLIVFKDNLIALTVLNFQLCKQDWRIYWLQICNKELTICGYGSDQTIYTFNLLQTKSLGIFGLSSEW